jgi:peptide deformylase|tara:strand:- start:801 stop:1418 length:618 start_codon:yes stop_codon:yes gene_type:complete
MVNNYVTFDDSLKNPCKKVSVDAGKKIAVDLFNKLVKDKNAIGLAANQIGINASVAVVNVIKPIILINPRIIKMWDEIPYVEGCLSFPGNPRSTKRYKYIQYTDSLIEESRGEDASVIYGPTADEIKSEKKDTYDRQLLESVCVQHEIDHLYGIRILDREQQLQPVRTERKIKRNEIIKIQKGDDVKVLKYKKAQSLLKEGWIMI